MTMLGLLAAAMQTITIHNVPVSRLDFVSGEIAAMMRDHAGARIYVASVNGRPHRPGDQGICFILSAIGGFDILGAAPAGAQLEVVQTLHVDGALPPAASVMGGASLLAALSARLTVRPDGSVATCTEGPGRVLQRVSGFREPPPVCETYLPGEERVFSDAAPGAGARSARMTLSYYLRRP